MGIVAVLQCAVRSFFPSLPARLFFPRSDHASSMKNNDAFLRDTRRRDPTRNFVPSWKWINFFFPFFFFCKRWKISLNRFSILYIYIHFADICKFVQKTKFYVVASRFPSTLNGSGFLYFCEKEIFKMEIPRMEIFQGFDSQKISNDNKFFP